MKAQNDRILARIGYMKESTGGIILASSTMEDGKIALNIGKVVSHGPGVTLRTGEFLPVSVNVGDIIVWEQFGGIRFDVVGKDLVCIRSEDIGCILEPGEYEQYLFDDDEIEAYKKQVEEERDAFQKKLRSASEAIEKKTVYQCWTNDCLDKLKDVEREPGKSQCETCGSEMREKQHGPTGHVVGGTPRFHA